MWAVMRFYHLLRAGITWKGPEVIELWYKMSDNEQGDSKDNVSVLCDIEEETEDNLNVSDDDDDDEIEKSAASGSDEDDSLLVAYDSNSIGSVWQKIGKFFQIIIKMSPNQIEIYVIVIFFIEIFAQIVSIKV